MAASCTPHCWQDWGQGWSKERAMRHRLNWALLALAVGSVTAGADPLSQAQAYSKRATKGCEADLLHLVSYPSVSADPSATQHIRHTADWLQTRLRKAGLEGVKLLGADNPRPSVYAQWLHAKDAPTILLYAHADVQPPDPLALWESPPFEPQKRNGFLYGRGISDNKAGVLQILHAAEAYLQTSGSPVNLKVLFETEEEIGSPGLASILEQHRDLLRADYAVSSDGLAISEDQNGIIMGLRGGIAVEVTVTTLSTDVHSGLVGGSVQNANVAMSRFISSLHTSSAAINISGWYSDVLEADADDEHDMAVFPYVEAEKMSAVGASEPFGEGSYSSLARTWLRPTCEVVGQWGGFTGVGIKTIVPAQAHAKIMCRTVPNQQRDKLMQAMRDKVEQTTWIPGARFSMKDLGIRAEPYLMARDSPVNQAAMTVLNELYSKPALFYRVGGGIPACVLFRDKLGIETTVLGVELDSDLMHAPNERISEARYSLGREAYIRLFSRIAENWKASRATEQASEL